MLKTCILCNKLFKGEDELCKSCSKGKEKNSIISCKNCGNLSVNTIEGLCKTCLKTTMSNLQIIKHYIYKNPDATVKNVYKALDIPKKEILDYVREGKLEVKKEDKKIKKFKKCGIKITPRLSLCLGCQNDLETINKLKNKTIKKKSTAFFTN